MCGIAGTFGNDWELHQLEAMQYCQRHRGPDAEGLYLDPEHLCGLAHNRLSIIDLSPSGRQPLSTADGKLQVILNGEIYNYLELRDELRSAYAFRTFTDTEVLLAAYQKWGAKCLDKLIGMFAFVIWDERTRTGFAARDRFGVKPFYYHVRSDGTLLFASEIKALHAAGVERQPNSKTWADYLCYGYVDCSHETFWSGISTLPAGHYLTWENGRMAIGRWYDIRQEVGTDFDRSSTAEVETEYLELMKDSVRLRFRADVPVGINISGGLDSSSLLSIVQLTQDDDSEVKAFTFITGDANYDELPWVEKILERTRHPLVVTRLSPEEVPDLAASVQEAQDEPYGGLPTVAYAKLFEAARANGVKVLLDGNGMDEQWGGYDYYQSAVESNGYAAPIVQGVRRSPVRPDCLVEEFRKGARPDGFPAVFPDKFRNLQYRDTVYTKIPRAMRFNDRVSMRSSTELREPFLDHRLFELAFRQPTDRKRSNGTGKQMLREITRRILPTNLTEAPKRPLQTPQREWLRGYLREWADDLIKTGLRKHGGEWLETRRVLSAWEDYCRGSGDNSYFVWQWVSLGMMSR